ncbi:MAG: YcgN family cysteine cluster protein [Proteobacteria bacterium]|nr:YcgN family cysteine cluster protein [Pseudomonadota bacterium]
MKTRQSNALRDNFWELPLGELNQQEWEQLCDGCGRCCLKKLSDEETEEITWTRVICRFFIEESSRCSCYSQRTELVPECLNVGQMDIGAAKWMPPSCAYRLRFEGKPLHDWHPLIAGSRVKMEQAGISVAGKVISEEYVHPDGYQEHVIRWVET